LGAFSLSRRVVIIGAATLTTVPIPRTGVAVRRVETGSINRRSTTTLALAKYRFQRCFSVGDAWDRIAKAKSSTVGYRRSGSVSMPISTAECKGAGASGRVLRKEAWSPSRMARTRS
jgi:hypothetical protein